MLFGMTLLMSVAACSKNGTDSAEPEDPNKLQSLTITPSPATVGIGQSLTLSVAGTPQTASLDALRWSSQDNQIARVDDDGTVTGIAAGSTTVTARCGEISTSCEVTVNNPVTGIELSSSFLSLEKGTTHQLTVALIPDDADTEGDIVWESNNPEIATVDQNGVVSGSGVGTTIITATLSGVSASCPVEVYEHLTTRPFTFLQLNLWEGLVNVSDGREALIQQLATLQPDAASFCEFPSTGSAESILTEAVEELYKRTGLHYFYTYRSGSGTRGLLTRHPILSTDAVNDNVWFYRTVIDFYGQEMALYASHAYHMYYACYLPRGYGDGASPYGWDKLPDGPITDVELILEREEQSGRSKIAQDLVADTREQQAQGRLCIFGGDLNQPSHLDWTEATKDNYEHNGCVVAWPVSTICYSGGMLDAFRTIYPDPVTHPGVTWPVSNKDATKETQWAAEADERDRIDFVYFRDDDKIEVKKAQILGPSAMIAKSAVVEDQFINKSEELIEPAGGVWPSDHRGLLITFEVKY